MADRTSVSDISIFNPDSTWKDSNARSVGYFAKGSVSRVGRQLIEELKAESINSGQNARISVHPNPDHPGLHEMFILQRRDQVHPPKKHEHKEKSFHVLEGQLAVFVFDDDGRVVDARILEPEGDVFYRVGPGVFHADIALTDIVVHHESTTGPFLDNDDCIWASWAPDRENQEALGHYRDTLFRQSGFFTPAINSVVITGAGGFAGGHLVQEFLNDGQPVISVLRDGPKGELDAARQTGTLFTIPRRLRSMALRTPIIVHAAARLSVNSNSPTEMVDDNVTLTRQMIDLALASNARQFIFMSAISIYGKPTVDRVVETTPITSPDAYAATKLLGEQMLAENSDKLPSVILRLPSLVGEGAQHGWLNGIVKKLSRNEPVAVINPDTPFNNIVHVTDLSIFAASLSRQDLSGSRIVNLAAADAQPIGQVVRSLRTEMASTSKIHEANDDDAPGFWIDDSAAREELGWTPPTMKELIHKIAAETMN